jgi:hypothetical protein
MTDLVVGQRPANPKYLCYWSDVHTTVRLVHTIIHRILEDAIEDNIRKDNPASSKAAKPPSPKM